MHRAIARYGDVDIFKISKLPDDVKRKRNTILAFGEATGHHHTLTAIPSHELKAQIDVYVSELSKKTFFEIKNAPANLTHQEHKTITLEPGIYEVAIEEG